MALGLIPTQLLSLAKAPIQRKARPEISRRLHRLGDPRHKDGALTELALRLPCSTALRFVRSDAS